MSAPTPIRRVLMTADTLGGVWTYALDLAQALAPHGIRVDLAAMGRLPTDRQREQAREAPGLTLHESGFRLEWMDDPWEDVARAGEWLLDLEQTVRPEVVHCNGYAHADLPWSAPVLAVAHSCVLSWWWAVRGEPAPPQWDEYRRRVAQGLARADMIAAPSRFMARAVTQWYTPDAPCRVVPNGRREGIFAPGPKEPFIFSAGRFWDEAKNLDILAAVSPASAWPVYVAGAAGDRTGDGLTLLGELTQPEMADWLSRAAVYALPARYEPFGLSVLEAALSGCALVLGDIASLRENWDGAALFVAPDDAGALARVLDRLARSPPLRSALALKALDRARNFSASAMAHGYIAAYRELAAVTHRPAFAAS